ncbi:hypothetical protein EJ05DRAFT_486889 [Pseudovirgaria hyperparasitica]|uniref:Uncharacterized protein n=1 Tax=Pseudovirgaria hyperparasitica TaxID=470096 RepID=A0A6A6W2P9_9PEZI|nr:uncharacterized protein EJ05DRAFT_486889 [Pseudovirgaria hyperparasitica]KAF2756863.1 hypothetical protein EJ05DRAFT_486889 [Pseudovirgaria hyperparasitica]
MNEHGEDPADRELFDQNVAMLLHAMKVSDAADAACEEQSAAANTEAAAPAALPTTTPALQPASATLTISTPLPSLPVRSAPPAAATLTTTAPPVSAPPAPDRARRAGNTAGVLRGLTGELRGTKVLGKLRNGNTTHVICDQVRTDLRNGLQQRRDDFLEAREDMDCFECATDGGHCDGGAGWTVACGRCATLGRICGTFSGKVITVMPLAQGAGGDGSSLGLRYWKK